MNPEAWSKEVSIAWQGWTPNVSSATLSQAEPYPG